MRRKVAQNHSIILTVAVAFIAGCTGAGGGGKLSLSGAPSVDDATSVSVSLDSVNSKTVSDWSAAGKIDGSSRINFNTPTVTIKGACVFGVAKVVAYVNSTLVSETATCQDDLSFTWTKTFPTGTPATGTAFAIELKPATSTGQVFNNLTSSQFISVNILVDDSAPTASTGATVANSIAASGIFGIQVPSVSITTTVSADVVQLKVDNYPSASASTPSGNSVTVTDTLTVGTQRTYNLVSYDRAGNASAPEAVTVKYSSPGASSTVLGTLSTSNPFLHANGTANGFYGGMGPAAVRTSSSNATLFQDLAGISTQQ